MMSLFIVVACKMRIKLAETNVRRVGVGLREEQEVITISTEGYVERTDDGCLPLNIPSLTLDRGHVLVIGKKVMFPAFRFEVVFERRVPDFMSKFFRVQRDGTQSNSLNLVQVTY